MSRKYTSFHRPRDDNESILRAAKEAGCGTLLLGGVFVGTALGTTQHVSKKYFDYDLIALKKIEHTIPESMPRHPTIEALPDSNYRINSK